MSAFFLSAVALLGVAAIVPRLQGAGIVLAGLLLASAGIMVAADIGGAGTDAILRGHEWRRRWLPWVRAPEPYSRVLKPFLGGIATIGGLFITGVGIALTLPRT